ncbi:MAG TPA: tetratricopeptide repeat protein [Rariglobus sp.]|jgi:tetratricopeptide (TPR) repeat protein|nr:tetratricopeptide repeat protein [Rariglobus sp.]
MISVGIPLRFSILFLCALALREPLHANDNPLDDAIALFNGHRVPEARALLAPLVESEPNNTQALWYLGKADILMQRREEAAGILQRAVKLSPQDHRILADYGTASLLCATDFGFSLKSIGYARQGKNALLEAVRLAPDVIAYREGLVAFYKQAPAIVGGSVDKAYAQAEEIAKRDPIRGTVIKASILASEKKYAEARAVCEESLRIQPDSYMALYTLGRIASESGQELARGEQALRRCLELTPAIQEPDFAGVHYRLGMIAEKSGHPDTARTEYQRALTLEPTFQAAASALKNLDK